MNFRRRSITCLGGHGPHRSGRRGVECGPSVEFIAAPTLPNRDDVYGYKGIDPLETNMCNLGKVLIGTVACIILFAAPSQGQSNPGKDRKTSQAADSGLVLRLNVRRVSIDVVVLDKQGNVVRGLKKKDFILKEDGKTQNVVSFDWMDGSIASFTPPKLPSLPPNTFMNVPSAPERGPLYILYYDLVNTSPDDQMTFRRELMKFVDEAQPGTRMALIMNAKGLHMLQGFTTDHSLLREAILRKGSGPHIPDVFIFGEDFGRNDVGGTLSNLTFMAEYLEGIPGRKNLLWMSTTFPIPVMPTLAAGASTATAGAAPQMGSVGAQGGPQVLDLTDLEKENIKRTFSALMRAQIALYPIAVSGVVVSDDSANGLTNHGMMDMIAAGTGGRAYYSDNRPHFLLDEAVEHGESYYTLSYAPSNAKFDGSERHVEVKLATEGDYKLSYRTGYYAVSDEGVQQEHKKDELQARFIATKATDTLYANIAHGAPMLHDLLFTAHLSANGAPRMATPEQMVALEDSPEYFKTHKKHPQKPLAPIKLQKFVIDYGVVDPQLRTAAAHQEKPAVLEFAAAAYDDDGKLMNSMLNQGVPTGNGGKQEALFHAIQELEVPPGAAFIRLAVRDTLTNRTGTLEVRLPLKAETDTANAGAPAKGTATP
jgi:VWFA-related protein